MIDPNIVLLEAQAFRIATAESLGYHEQFGYAQVNDLATWFPHTDELSLEIEFLERLDANALSTIRKVDETLTLRWNDTVVRD